MTMDQKKLDNKPLVEAILELRWQLQGEDLGPQTDQHYKILLARFFDRILTDYPEHEQLPTASIPDELVGHIVQHRFRLAKESWPLVQLGPGIFTVNSTSDYQWQDFRPRALSAVKQLYDAHPKRDSLKITNIILRYIDAIEFDYLSDNILDFLRGKLKLNIQLPGNLFDKDIIDNKPNSLSIQTSFKCKSPKGIINIRFATGQKNNSPALVWETTIESAGEDVPDMQNAFDKWIDAAHENTDDWFFKMIEGDLERRFSNE
jgi:uncharacterized protein (TIGR04255 family)